MSPPTITQFTFSKTNRSLTGVFDGLEDPALLLDVGVAAVALPPELEICTNKSCKKQNVSATQMSKKKNPLRTYLLH